MARKKEPPKPILALRDDFVDSLANLIQQATMLDTALQIALDNGLIAAQVRPILNERLEALHQAIYGELPPKAE